MNTRIKAFVNSSVIKVIYNIKISIVKYNTASFHINNVLPVIRMPLIKTLIDFSNRQEFKLNSTESPLEVTWISSF